ncbi:hypothetical protein MYSTI_02548 [Myxococcus stipitatus DSM 14675]|uniref:Uncharacterized protein n=1 Tax=Myxococcus stipitatus (strain DSM 14675 / JCM 12634 / Mx s8) TaxID=1278073 RepID=L7UBL2_MYXSD|nr:hypothetical protein MYSTI_02548 [Myxococcus stipitatus DSM 14675]
MQQGSQVGHFGPGFALILDILKWEWTNGQVATDANGLPPEKQMLFTDYPAGGHEIWDSVYQDPKVIAWMLAQQRP